MNAFSLSRIQEYNTMKIKVAFVCVHNSCRSQIAEALAKKYTYKKVDWGVADPSGKPDEEFITVIKEIERKVLDLIEEVKEWENN